MALLRKLYFFMLFTFALTTPLKPAHLTDATLNDIPHSRNVLSPRVPPNWISTQSIGGHFTWGIYATSICKSTAILPIVAAARPMAGFYRQATLAAQRATTANLVTNSFTFGLGALTLYVDTLDGSPIDWDMVVQFAERMMVEANRGWPNHYGALVKNRVTGVLTLVSLEAASGAVGAWLNAIPQSNNGA